MVAIARDIFRPHKDAMPLNGNRTGKFDLSGQLIFGTHRSGWKFALESLIPLNNPNGILFDGYIENTFGFRIDEAVERGEIPYRQPWIGIAHHPPQMPQFMEYRTSPQHVFNNYYMKESLAYCQGIYVMSEYHRDWLVKHLPNHIPVHVLIHPTEATENTFEIENFLANPDKKIISVGHWLRKMSSIKLLPVSKYRKVWIVAEEYSTDLQIRERFATPFANNLGLEIVGQYSEMPWVSHEEYDKLLSENIVFVDYYDLSASNTIIECIVRKTPILVNRHPAAEEYLGKEYPFFYNSLDEAAEKVQSLDCIEDAFDYLLELSNIPYTQHFFRGSILNSEIYKNLPENYESACPPAPITAKFDTIADLHIIKGRPLETKYVFAICYRNLTWKLVRCIESILALNHNYYFGLALVDDCSGSAYNNADAIKMLEDSKIPFVYVKNPERKYLCRNLYNISTLLSVNPDAIIVQVDGDDLLPNIEVLEILDKAYDAGAQMTFGSFHAISDQELPQSIKNWLALQKVNMDDCWDIDLCPSWMHLKTYKKTLFEKVPKQYHLEKSGKNWLQTGEDLSVQPKMIQLANGKVEYIKEKIYVYDVSGQKHELLDPKKPKYILDNLYRLPHGSYIGECMDIVQVANQNERLLGEKKVEAFV